MARVKKATREVAIVALNDNKHNPRPSMKAVVNEFVPRK